MTVHSDSRATLQALCDTLDAVPGPMREAFVARLRMLERGAPSSTHTSADSATDSSTDPASPLPQDQRWWDDWYDQVVALLHLALDDPRAVAQAAALVRWGVASGISQIRQQRALDALAWACRDIAPERMTPATLAAIEARGTLIARVGRRLDAPPVPVRTDATEGRRG